MIYRAYVRIVDFTGATVGPPVTPALVNAISIIIADDDTTLLFGGPAGFSVDLHYSDVDGDFINKIRTRVEDQIRDNVASVTTLTEAQAMEIIWLD